MTITRLRCPFGLAVGIGLMLSELCVAQHDKPAPEKPKPAWPKPKITISKETTWATEPLGADGFIDYLEVVNRRHSKEVTIENNAAVLLYQAMGPSPEETRLPDRFFRRLGIEPPPDEGMYFQPSVDLGNAILIASERPWKTTEFPDVAEWLRENESVLLTATEATERSRYFSPLVSTDAKPDGGMIEVLLPGVQMSRDVARALAARAMKNLAEGRQLDAWRDLLAVHRLGRLIGQGPMLIEYLVGLAVESMAIHCELEFLSETKPSAKLLAMYRKQLDRLPARASITDKFDIAERVSFLDTAHRLARGQMTLRSIALNLQGEADENSLVQKLGEDLILQSADWNELLKSANAWYDRIVDAYSQPDYRERLKSLKQLDQDIKELVAKRRSRKGLPALLGSKPAVTQALSDDLISQLLPGFTQVSSAEGRAIQRMRNLEVAFALALWRTEHEAYPDSLDQLAPKYLVRVPTDLFNGDPLRYARTAEGYLLYSVGPNAADDNGRDDQTADDIVVRMPMRTHGQ